MSKFPASAKRGRIAKVSHKFCIRKLETEGRRWVESHVPVNLSRVRQGIFSIEIVIIDSKDRNIAVESKG